MKKLLFVLLLVGLAFGGYAQEASADADEQAKTETKKDKKKKKTKTARAKSEDKHGSTASIETKDANLSLADYLRRVPGVQVQGSGDNVKVLIRGVSTTTGSTDPLYIIDRTPIGNSYAQVSSMVDVNQIRRVEVLKDAASTSFYGMRGSNGVIIIRLKKQ